MAAWSNCWTISRVTGELRRYDAQRLLWLKTIKQLLLGVEINPWSRPATNVGCVRCFLLNIYGEENWVKNDDRFSKRNGKQTQICKMFSLCVWLRLAFCEYERRYTLWSLMCSYVMACIPGADIKAGSSNCIQHNLWDIITCPCPWYLLLSRNSSYVCIHVCIYNYIYIYVFYISFKPDHFH